MRVGNFIYHFISGTISLFFVIVGVVGLTLPWSPNVQATLVTLITEHTLTLFLFSFCFIVIGLAILINQLFVSRHKFYHVRLGKHFTEVDANVIQGYLVDYWKTLFPNDEIPSHVTIKNNEIHINVDFPPLPLVEQKALLEKIDQDLSQTFSKILGYQGEFVLSASFPSE